MKILVTGAGGFVGQHLVRHILELTDWSVVVLGRSGGALLKLGESERITPVQYDLRDKLRRDAFSDVDAVVNLAASSDVQSFLDEPVRHAQNNVTGTLNLLEWARRRRLTAFIQVSTNEVYGPATGSYQSREWDPLLPSTPYSASKAAQEVMAIGWRQTYGVPVVIVNTMHLFGEGQPRRRFVPTAIAKLLAGERVPIYRDSDGHQSARNWLYVGDLAHALVKLLHTDVNTRTDDLPDRWNVAGPELTCSLLASRIANFLGVPLTFEWITGERRPGYETRYALDTAKLQRELNFSTHYGIDHGLRRTVNWMREGTTE